jgi:4-amino-4-deoxy-L-arabinose transferase-like glycosyltransferase
MTPDKLMMPPKPPPDGRFAWDVLWVGFLMLYVVAGRTVAPFHGDESIYTAMSVDYAYAFIERDASKLLYSDAPVNPIEQSYRITDAVLMRYFIGAAWHIAGFNANDLNAPWWFAKTYEFNVANGYYPGDELLLVARIPAVLFTAGAVLLLFLIGLRLQGRVSAYIASLYFGLNPVVLLSGRRCAKEAPHMFFELFVLLAAIQLLAALVAHEQGPRRGLPAWLWAVVLGGGCGFAVASKYTNVMVVLVALGSVGLYALLYLRHRIVVIVGQLVMAGAISLLTFWAVNPVFWNGPVERAVMSAQIRMDVLAGQVSSFDNSYHDSLGLRLRGLWRLVFAGGPPQYYEAPEWAEYIGGQIAYYEATNLMGVPLPGTGVPLLGLVVLGYAVLWGWLKPMPVFGPAQWVLSFWGGALLIYVTLLVPLGWQRYYIPVFPMLGLAAGLGVLWVVNLYLRDAKRNSRQYTGSGARVVTQD